MYSICSGLVLCSSIRFYYFLVPFLLNLFLNILWILALLWVECFSPFPLLFIIGIEKKKSLISVYLSFIQPNSLINPVLCLFKLEPLGFFLMYTIICKSREICFFFYWHTLILLLFQNNFKFIKSCKNNNNTRNIHISNR